MNDSRNETLLRLAALRETLISFAQPQVLNKILDLCETLGTKRDSFLKQFKFWIEKNGSDCRYAAMAKNFFLEEEAKAVAKEIIWLYDNWAKFYKEKE
jgi:hypothetical protein